MVLGVAVMVILVLFGAACWWWLQTTDVPQGPKDDRHEPARDED